MRQIFFTVIFAYVLTAQAHLCAKPGEPIPTPRQNIYNVIKNVKLELARSIKSKMSEEAANKTLESILIIKIEYTKHIIDLETGKYKPLKNWCWIVTLVDRIQNDHSWTYKIDGAGKVTLIDHTT